MDIKTYQKDCERTNAPVDETQLEYLKTKIFLHHLITTRTVANDSDIIKRGIFYKTPSEELCQRQEESIKLEDSRLYTLEHEDTQLTPMTEKDAYIVHGACGITSEGAELMDACIEYSLGRKSEIDRTNIEEEVGDVLWYCSLILNAIGSDFETVAEKNINKLKERYPEQFTEKDAHNRDLEKEREVLES